MRAPRVLIATFLALGLAAALYGEDKKDKKSAAPPPPSTPSYSVTILPFQDLSQSAHGSQLKDTLGKHLQFLLVSNTNLTPRLVGDEAGNIEAAADIGRSQNSDLVLMGTVLGAEVEERESGSSGIGFGGITMGGKSKSQDAVVVLQVEVVDVARGKRITSLRITGKDHQDKASATSIGTGHGSFDMGSPDFRKSALGKATEKALNDLLAQFVRAASQFKPPAPEETGAASTPAPPPAAAPDAAAAPDTGPAAASTPDASAPPAPPAPATANCTVVLKVIGPAQAPLRSYNATVNGADMSGFVRSGLLRIENPGTPLQLQIFVKWRPPLAGRDFTGNYAETLPVGCTKAEETLVLELDTRGKGSFWWE